MQGALPLEVRRWRMGLKVRDRLGRLQSTDPSGRTAPGGASPRRRSTWLREEAEEADAPSRSPRSQMPELLEVESRRRRDLQRLGRGRARSPMRRSDGRGTIRHPEPEQFVAEIRGARMQPRGPAGAESVLIANLADGAGQWPWRCAMTGAAWSWRPAGTPDGSLRAGRVPSSPMDGGMLRYRDVRKFGARRPVGGRGVGAPSVRTPWSLPSESGTRKAPYRVGDVFAPPRGRSRWPRPPPPPSWRSGCAGARHGSRRCCSTSRSSPAVRRRLRPTRRCGGARLHPLRPAELADTGRGAAAASGRAVRPAPGHQQPWAPVSASYVGADDQPGDGGAERLAVSRRTGRAQLFRVLRLSRSNGS